MLCVTVRNHVCVYIKGARLRLDYAPRVNSVGMQHNTHVHGY